MSRKTKASEIHSSQTQQQQTQQQQQQHQLQLQQQQHQHQSQQHLIQHAQATLQSSVGTTPEGHILQSNFPSTPIQSQLRKQNTQTGVNTEQNSMANSQGIRADIHRSGSTIGQIPFGASAPDLLYTSADFKLLEERVVDQIRAVIHESELRTCRKMFEWIEWSNQQQSQALDNLRQELNLAYGNGNNNEDAAETFNGTVHDGGASQTTDLQETPTVPNVFQAQPSQQQQSQQQQQQTPNVAAARATATARMRAGATRGGRRTGAWPGVQRSETFATPSPARAASYVPATVNRAMTMPQGFGGSPTNFTRFNALDVSVLGGSIAQDGSQLQPGAKRPPKLTKGTSTFAVAGSPAAAQQFKIPTYKLSRAIKTVQELWLEWTVGFAGGPAVKQLEDMFKSSWRNGMAERQFFSRRKVLLDEVMKRGSEMYEEEVKKRDERKQALLQQEALNPGSAAQELQKLDQESQSEELWNFCHAQAAEDLDKERGRMSLNALSGKLRKQRQSNGGTKGEFDGENHHDDEDAEGEGDDDDNTQMTDTQMTESQLQSQLQSQAPTQRIRNEDDPMDLEGSTAPQSKSTKKTTQQSQRNVTSPNTTNGSQSQPSQPEDPLTVIARDVISQQHHPRPHPHHHVPVLPSQPASQSTTQSTTQPSQSTSSASSASQQHHALASHLAASVPSLTEHQSFSTADWAGFVGDLGAGGVGTEDDADGDGEVEGDGEDEDEDEEEEVQEEVRASKKRRTE